MLLGLMKSLIDSLLKESFLHLYPYSLIHLLFRLSKTNPFSQIAQ
jgi:hypothetical protein